MTWSSKEQTFLMRRFFLNDFAQLLRVKGFSFLVEVVNFCQKVLFFSTHIRLMDLYYDSFVFATLIKRLDDWIDVVLNEIPRECF